MYSIFIVEDHPAMRRAYSDLIDGEPGLSVCGMAESAEEALEAIPSAGPDLVIVDISLKGINGIQLVQMLHEREPNLPLLVISGHDSTMYAQAAIEAGARGYLMKHETGQITKSIFKAIANEPLAR